MEMVKTRDMGMDMEMGKEKDMESITKSSFN
jgi:hypothetical protein